MKNCFIDCGSNLGQGFEEIAERYDILSNLDNWDIYMFEPNPDCLRILQNKFQQYENFYIAGNAVWTENCKKAFRIQRLVGDFNVRGLELSGENFVGGASTLTRFDEIDQNGNYKIFDEDFSNWREIDVKCIDFHEFLSNLDGYNKIFGKIDIEGAELDVLPYIIKHGSILKFDQLFIEFHAHLLKSKPFQLQQDIKTQILNLKIPLEIWK